MARIRKNVDAHTALLIYKQTILPILDYNCILFNSSTQSKIGKLQPLQNRAIRIVEKRTGYISTLEMKNLYVKLNLKMLNDRRKLFMLKLTRNEYAIALTIYVIATGMVWIAKSKLQETCLNL